MIGVILLCALVVFLFALGLTSLLRARRNEADERIRSRLGALAAADANAENVELLVRRQMSDVPWFNRFLEQMRWAANLSRLVAMSKAPGTPGLYLLMSASLAITGVYSLYLFTGGLLGAGTVGVIMAYLPIAWLKRRKNKRMDRFQAQLPEALDLLARALKAGHTFGGGMRMVADEFEDPIGSEIRQTIDEINYGMDADRALDSLMKRVECPDLKFFVVSVNIQRETGGNLAEIISNIARLVRERFQLHGKIKVLSAEGRISALILILLPFAVAGILYVINPGYMSLLWTTELGRTMAVSAACSMALGAFVIRRMIKIKV
ncbi:type II secretion system F family protein [Salidesulfovibrio brasiliensis]|uniref:type II secretion system F family protein n=1 Tax=Salidesulfovibrio brasiliensis TaxID=221711 RepID=UPI0006D21D88|nr:type II secretion system F family protein [Salidesulfovibrio brasiliensis]